MELARDIRDLSSNMSRKELAKLFHVGVSTIHRVLSGELWNNV
jgi:transposase